MMAARLLLLPLLLAMLVSSVTAAGLRIYQGRITFSPPWLEIYRVERVATVEIGGESPPTYFFDCNTTANDGTGITWRRVNGRHRFSVGDPVVGNGERLDASNINYPDLDIYICEDNTTRESIQLNITSVNPAIVVDDSMVGVVKGQTAEFRIYASSYPLLSSDHIHWYRPDGSEILDNEATFQESGKVLLLRNVQPADVGTYECEISIPFALTSLRASTTFDLDVYVTPSILQHPQNLSNVIEWTDITISCVAEGNPPPTITWEREGGGAIPINTRVNTRIENDTVVVSSLTFMAIRQASSGRYRCVASTIYTASTSSYYSEIIVTPAIRLDIRVDGQLHSSDDPLIVVENGGMLSIDCFGSGTLQWSADNGLPISLSSSDRLHQVIDVTRDVLKLVIQGFNRSYETTYTCSSTLGVESSVFVTNANPAVFISNSTQYVLPGNSSTISATVFAYPQNEAVSQWFLNGQEINVDTDSRYSISIDENEYSLHVRNVEASLLGEYMIVVTVQGQNSSDSVNLSFPDPPTAVVSPSSLMVTEGDQVRFQCHQGGSGTLTATWSVGDGRALPEGVVANSTDLIISSVSSIHRGTYVCSVSSFAGSQTSSGDLNVFYRPTTVIRFNQHVSTSNQYLFLPLSNGQQGTTIVCTADGNPPPTYEWVQMTNGGNLPKGVVQEARENGHELKWNRPTEYTDSGMYECRATNSNGTSVVTLELLVEITPEIDTIYPTVPVTSSDQRDLNFFAPIGYVGVALTCTAFGWPPPSVEWNMNAGPLPSGVVSVTLTTSANSAIVNSVLRWTRGFQTTDAGQYHCVVRRKNSTDIAASQSLTISEGTATPPPPSQCSISASDTIYFQIRVFDTECTSWDSSLRQHIANEFRNEILNIVESECSCGSIESNYVQILDPECSQVEEGAVVFRGLITTSSSSLTKEIFCSLSRWQTSGSYVTVNSQNLHSVDSQCPLQLSTLSSSECVNTQPEPVNQALIIYIAVGAVGVLIVIMLVLVVICCVSCCCLKKKSANLPRQPKENSRVPEETYSRTHDPTLNSYRHGRHSVGPTSDSPILGAPLYSTLENIPPRSTPPLPPPPPFQPSPEHDINYPLLNQSTDLPDGDAPAESYQIRVSSDSVKFYKQSYFSSDGSDPSTSTSRLTSPTQKTPQGTSQSSSDSTTLMSATNPIGPDYEQIDAVSRVPNSDPSGNVRILPHGSATVDRRPPTVPHGRKFSESGTSAAGGPIPPTLSASVMFAVREEEEKLQRSISSSSTSNNSRPDMTRTGSAGGFNRSRSAITAVPSHSANNFNLNQHHSQSISKVPLQHQLSHPLVESQQMMGPPPPYSSRPPSAMTASASSMVGNNAYESREMTSSGENGNNHGPKPWYKTESDFSLDSTSRPDLNTQERIPPYAMVHNSAIPVTQNGRPLGTSLPNNIQALPHHQQSVMVDGGSATKRPVLFSLDRKSSRGSPQPYSEPIQSSMDTLASYGRAQESPNFETVMV